MSSGLFGRKVVWQQHSTYRVSPHTDRARNGFLGVFPGSRHAWDERLVARDDVDEKVKLVGLAKRLGDVRP